MTLLAPQPLTKLTDTYTFALFERLLTAEVERARRYRYSVSVLSLDVDDFSAINRDFGSAVGDGVLRELAVTVRKLERTSDSLARRSDDEFIVMLPQTTSNGAEIVAHRLHRALAGGLPIETSVVPVRVSIGIATFPDQVQDGNQLVSAADIALYAAKAKSKNRGSNLQDAGKANPDASYAFAQLYGGGR